jgi:curved DNA-binding protein CbpA
MPASEPDPYSVLQVARSATQKEIRAAYRLLVARYHPDRHQGNPLEDLASARMTEINRAYELLSDPERRAAFQGGASQARPARAAAERAVSKRVVKGAALLLALPLLFRVGPAVARALALVLRAAIEGLVALRGPRLAAGVGLIGIAILALAIKRRRKR